MNFDANVTLMDRQAFKPVCDQCGSLTVALPIEAQPDPVLDSEMRPVRVSKRDAAVAAQHVSPAGHSARGVAERGRRRV